MIFIFFHYSWITVFCQFFTVQQGDPITYTYIHLFSHSVMLHHRQLDIVPRGSHCLSIPKAIVYIYEPQIPNPSYSFTSPPWQPQVCSPSPWFSFHFRSWSSRSPFSLVRLKLMRKEKQTHANQPVINRLGTLSISLPCFLQHFYLF